MLKNKSFILLLSICLMFYACVEPFSLEKQQERKILTVDATINDLSGEQSIKIIDSYSGNDSFYEIPVTNAKVEIIVNNTERVVLTERGKGVYVLPISFHTRVGDTYKLAFQKDDGTKYESAEERQTSASEITQIYDEFRLDGIETPLGFNPAHYVYIDTNDPADQKNNYMWTWKLWERQNICATCIGGRFFLTPAPARCKAETAYSDVSYDYTCNGACWDMFYNKDLNVFTDVFSNGKPILGRLVGKIPYYASSGALIEIKQQSISAEAYRYLKLLADQVQNNGSLVDTPPAAIIGNVKNISNQDEAVAGFFMVTSVRSKRYWISRENAKGLAAPIGLVDHPIVYEPSQSDTSRPPLAPCNESNTRTTSRPEGWIN